MILLQIWKAIDHMVHMQLSYFFVKNSVVDWGILSSKSFGLFSNWWSSFHLIITICFINNNCLISDKRGEMCWDEAKIAKMVEYCQNMAKLKAWHHILTCWLICCTFVVLLLDIPTMLNWSKLLGGFFHKMLTQNGSLYLRLWE